MLKNIFKSNRNQNKFKSHLDDFSNEFSQKQKEAIFFSIAMMMMIDDKISIEEKEFFYELSHLMNFKFDIHKHSMSVDKMYKILKTLTKYQMDWYIVTLYGLINVEGIVKLNETKGFIEILEELEIDFIDAMETIQKAALFDQQFG